MYFDGSFTLNGARGGIVLISRKGDRLLYIIRLHFSTTNNVVEPSSGFSGFTSMTTPSSSSTKSWDSQTAMTPAWRHIDRRLGGWRKSLMVSSFIISSDETTKRPTPSPGSRQATNRPLQKCSHRTYSSPPFDLRRTSWHSRREPHRVRTARYLCRDTIR
jgi:hypothetical protein